MKMKITIVYCGTLGIDGDYTGGPWGQIGIVGETSTMLTRVVFQPYGR